jgi:hypothetical protein
MPMLVAEHRNRVRQAHPSCLQDWRSDPMLLRRSHLLVIPAVIAVALGACTVKDVDDDDFEDSTGVQTGGGGEGNSGAAGGFGGEGATGGVGGSGVGGSGGSGECAGEDGVESGAACTDANKLPVAASPDFCTPDGGTGGDLPPPAVTTCNRLYEIYKNGVADAFLFCADDIGTQLQESCSNEEVQACMTVAHQAACPDQDVVDSCGAIVDFCAGFGDTSMGDGSDCVYLVTPFNDAGYNLWAACTEAEPQIDPDTNELETCQVQVGRCWDEVLNPQ